MHEVDSYLRLAMMFSGNQARTSNNNIEKMCELILLESYPKALTTGEIVDELLSKYSLIFADGEILDVLTSKKAQCNILCVNPELKRIGDRKYTLIEETYKKLDGQERHSFTEKVIEQFIKDYDDLGLSKEEFTDLLDRYFYFAFNNNANIILGLLQPDHKENAFLSNENNNFTDVEKEIINQFITWDNSEKDKCVYEMVSCCFDYCMLTARKGADDFRSVFNGKQFFLDTNIIFRAIGINQDNRKRVIESFLSKCRAVNIKIIISNFTIDEIEKTIDHYVSQISNIFKGRPPLNQASIANTIPDYINTDFYKCYCDWCAKKENIPGNYEDFKEFLIRKAYIAISQYKSDTSASFETLSPEKFHAYCESLAHYKKARTWYVNENSVKTDVNNFMRVVGLNDKNPASNLFNANTYLISADHPFCDWAKEIRPGAIPLVVLPSVWYAIILQYDGRAEDNDYASFTRFLKFSLSSGEVPNERWGRALIERVLGLDEKPEIQDKIIENVTNRLKSDMKDLDDEIEFYNLVDEEHKYITEQAVEEAKARVNAANELESQAQKDHFNKELNRIGIQHKAELDAINAEKEKLIQQGVEKEREHHKELRNIEINAKKKHRQTIIDDEARNITPKKRRTYITIFIVLSIVLLLIIGCGILWIFKIDEVSDGKKIGLGIAEAVISLLVIKFFFMDVIYNNWFCKLQSSEIDKKVRWDLEQKYPKIEDENEESSQK